MVRRLDVYTDGACLVQRTPKPDSPGKVTYASEGVGGWSWWVRDTLCDNGGDESTTNQRMEMQGVIQALVALEGEAMTIYSDSAYVVNCINEGWYRKWRGNGWMNSKNQPVANQDLWTLLIAGVLEADVDLIHIRGHQGIKGNEKADELAVAARIQKAIEIEKRNKRG